MLLQPEERVKLDQTSDSLFYDFPRFVTHVDEGFIANLSNLYRERLLENGAILDLMSSWVSHLPEDMTFERVVGHGMNEEELAKNPRLDEFFVQNLNEKQTLPLENESFDAVLIAVSVQYVQYPEAVFSEVARVLKPGGVAIVSFSNRMFFQKAIAAWRAASEPGRLELVKRYFRAVEGFGEPEVVRKVSGLPTVLQLMGFSSSDPFYAVLATKQGYGVGKSA